LWTVTYGAVSQKLSLAPFFQSLAPFFHFCWHHFWIGVNTFLPKEHAGEVATEIELIRSTPAEKAQQIANVKRYGEVRNPLRADSLASLQKAARERKNVFEELMEAVKFNSLGQISHALYEVRGEYRRNM
jgi:isobutyryl-CoA mutase